MSKITRFTFEHNNVRTLGDPISPQFIASDLAVILGYQSTKDATRVLDDDEKGVVEIETNFYEVVTELHLPLLEGTLERHGYSVKGMPCYKHLMNNH